MRRPTKAIGIFLAVSVVTISGYLAFQAPSNLRAEMQELWATIGLGETPVLEIAEGQVPQTVAVSKGTVRQTVIAPGQTEYVDTTLLATSVGGRVAKVLVRPGDIVQQGVVLAQLDTGPLETALTAAQMNLQRAEEEYDQKRNMAELALRMARVKLQSAMAEHQRQLSEAELAVAIALSRLEQARLQYPAITAANIRLSNAIEVEEAAAKEYQEAVERRDAQWEPSEIAEGYRRALEAAQDARAIAETDYSAVLNSQAASVATVDMLEAEAQKAQIALQRLQQGIDPLLEMGVESAQAALDSLIMTGIDPAIESALEKAAVNLEAATLVAPFDGMILEVQVKAGESILPGTELFVIADPSAMEVLSTVIEEDLPLVQIGQEAELFFDATPERIFHGRVTYIHPQRLPFEDRPLYYVSIKLDEIPSGLASGMTADATIVISEHQDVLRLPRALVRAGISEITQVSIWSGGTVQEREIHLGMRGDMYIEILGGLSEGEQVVGQ
jgi:RND family efflux transporter MFP subunit